MKFQPINKKGSIFVDLRKIMKQENLRNKTISGFYFEKVNNKVVLIKLVFENGGVFNITLNL